MWFSSETNQELGAPAPWSFEGSPAISCDPPTWCGAATTLCAGDVETPSFVEKLLSEPGAKVTVIVFTEETWWPSSNTLSECYNNVDVGVPLWLTEP